MSSRNGRGPDPREHARAQAEQSELSSAQNQAQSAAQQAAQGPIVDMYGEEATELLDRLTDIDAESSEFQELESYLQPFLSQMLMLANHDSDQYYDDLGNELLNENLFDRLVVNRRRGRLQTGPFLEVAQDVEHDRGPTRKPLDPHTREAIRDVLINIRTAMQSQGRGDFFSGLTEMHVSSEVRRQESGQDDGGTGLLGTLNPLSKS